jgi:hypothetical protein
MTTYNVLNADSTSIRTPIPRPSGHFQAGSDAGTFTTIDLFFRSEEVVVERLSMRKIREVLRLKFDAGLSVRKIAQSLCIGHSSSGDYLCRFAASGLRWPISISNAELNRYLFPPISPAPSYQRPMPDWAHVHAELRRPGVTLALLWQEYRLAHPQSFQYSWFCEHYRLWAAKVDMVMRQEHRAGEKLFVDYAGQTVPVIDRRTGEIRQTQIFVAVLGASSYTFAEATWSQKLPDWLGSHVR